MDQTVMSNGPDSLETILSLAASLSPKQHAELLDALRQQPAAEMRIRDLRYSILSTSEYKRAKKSGDDAMMQWIESFVPSDVFFEIGANTGAMSLFAGRRHAGRVPVVAFEPAIDTFDALVRNVLLNDLGGVVTALPIALLDVTGLQPFYYHSLGAGRALHAAGEPVDYARRPFTPVAVHQVMAYRLDDLMEALRLPHPTRVVVDVDGFEHKVLAGAQRTFTSGPMELFIECFEVEPGDPHPQELDATLRSMGFAHVRTIERRAPGTFPRGFDALYVRARG